VIEFRDNDWFKKRSLQIPEAWMQPWRNACEKTHTLDLEYLTEISALTREQYKFNFKQDDILKNLNYCYPDNLGRSFLEFYSSFDIDQWEVLVSKSGLDVALFTDAQFAAFRKLAASSPNCSYLEWMSNHPDNKVRIVVTRTKTKQSRLCYALMACETGMFADGKYHKDHRKPICGFPTPAYIVHQQDKSTTLDKDK
jgi:hypothetical protein